MDRHMLPIDDRTPEEKLADRERGREVNERLVDEVEFLGRLTRYARGR
jgi:hypothetical protein